MEHLVEKLLEQNLKLTDQIVELARLALQAPQPVYAQPADVSRFPLHIPETEEDARAAYEAGDISKEDLEGVLREIEFYNHEITVPTPGT